MGCLIAVCNPYESHREIASDATDSYRVADIATERKSRVRLMWRRRERIMPQKEVQKEE